MEYRFCPLCGTYLEKDYTIQNSLPYCPLGHFTHYPTHNITAIDAHKERPRKVREKTAKILVAPTTIPYINQTGSIS